MIDPRVYQTSCEIILKTTLLKSVLCDYSDMYVLDNFWSKKRSGSKTCR